MCEASLYAAFNNTVARVNGEDTNTSVKMLTVSPEAAMDLHKALLTGFNAGFAKGYKRGELLLYHRHSTRRFSELVYTGYNTYAKNKGTADTYNGDRQLKCTTIIPGTDIGYIKAVLPLQPFLDAVRSFNADMDIIWIDILRQSSSGANGGKEALFTWHQDNESNRPNVKLTVIFLLTATSSSMQVCGSDEVYYTGQGSGVGFASELYHRSGFAEEGTMKIAFFLSGSRKRCLNQVRSEATQTFKLRIRIWHKVREAWLVDTLSDEVRALLGSCREESPDEEIMCFCGKPYATEPDEELRLIQSSWICCDKCDRWCHTQCAGVASDYSGDYVCPDCV